MLREMGLHPIHQAVTVVEAQRILTKITPDIIISERDIKLACANPRWVHL
jgi:hypothetical protein